MEIIIMYYCCITILGAKGFNLYERTLANMSQLTMVAY